MYFAHEIAKNDKIHFVFGDKFFAPIHAKNGVFLLCIPKGADTKTIKSRFKLDAKTANGIVNEYKKMFHLLNANFDIS